MRWFLLLVILFGVEESLEAGQTRVRPSVRHNGSYVQPHVRTTPNRTKIDNWNTIKVTSIQGSRNPW